MATGGDDAAFERTWQRLSLPHDRTAEIALDATITPATLATPPAPPLPRISVHDAAGDTSVAPGAIGPDLTVVGLLGEGGMGRVELARQRSLARDVAVKRPRTGASELAAAAVRHEALVTGHLEHPSIIPVHALGCDDAEQPLIVMKRVEGVTWRDLIRDDEHPAWASREPSPAARLVWHLQTLGQVCNAVAFAHSRGMVHRDIKPDNVMIGDFGEVYLLDWGLATRAGEPVAESARALVGTPAYMAPEMVSGGTSHERTDVYLLGATLHEVLTRSVRHAGGDLQAVLRAAFASVPVGYPDEVPSELAELANRATARDPADRPESAIAFRQALTSYLRHRGSSALCDSAADRIGSVEEALARGDVDRQVDRWLDECRFAYRAALREWADNPVAQAGLARCAIAAVRLEVVRGNPGAARAALGELASPPAKLVAEVVALEADRDAGEAERERLRRLAHDVDPSAAAGYRRGSMIAMLIVGTAISGYAIFIQYSGRTLARSELLFFPALLILMTIVAAIRLRRMLLVNSFNRRLTGWFFVLLTFLLVNRAAGFWLGTTVPHQFALDTVGMSGLFATGAIFLFRWIWLCFAVMATGAVIGVLVPEVAFLVFCIAASLAMVVAVLALPRSPSS